MSEALSALRQIASANDTASRPESSSFVTTISNLLERVEYRRCDKGEDLEDLYRLRYKAYRTTDMVPPNASMTIHDEYDETPNSYKYGIFIDGQLASTLRIHHISPAERRSPSMNVYGDILEPLLDEGNAMIDPTRFAVDPDFTRLYPQIPYLTLRLASMACFHFSAPFCLSTIRPDHAAFYRRIFLSEQLGGLRSFPGLNYSVVLYKANVLAIRERSYARYPFFFATKAEQRMLFDRPSLGEGAPLTVLPTAKYLSDAA